ncbi:hypothetical protein [Methanoplanus endosymbiosus]|uniref:Uncharacterized protein n=1 Tax=Methanoplanus endosymbiosus TaxID=33865 RepID=A0A9E7PRW2_9EURY|nr:hypothetical protein [Methanoplanus endosymbiosus]UUX92482.1 hypothetical protein L6E24_14300 [Methanoplanus endosymbiosus]
MPAKDSSDLSGYTTIRIKNSTLQRLKYNKLYSDSLSGKIDYLITYWEAAAEHFHKTNMEFLKTYIDFFNDNDGNNQAIEDLKKEIEEIENFKKTSEKDEITYVTAEMVTTDSSGIEEKKLYVTFYRKGEIPHKDMKRHPFALLITTRGSYKFYIPFNEDCLTGSASLKEVEKRLEIPEWIEAGPIIKKNKDDTKTVTATIGVDKSYKRVIPGGDRE